MSVRTRMAPSPTGEYHIGHIRTVLYNYAYAKKHGGRFIIRIEDTDRERFVDGAVDRILDVIKDYGIEWDEGPRVGGDFGPYVQSERLEIYKKYAQELVDKGVAYYCFCSQERLEKIRDEQRAKGMPTTKYDRHCLHLDKKTVESNLKSGLPYVIRLRVPDNEVITFHDEVLGDISINSDDIDDQVLIKSDGFPTYQLAVVVDDHLMGITHVMRGTDWVPSTPKHIILYRAFGWEIPKHIHLPNLKELGGSKKLSKRFGSVAALEFLQEGYLPEASLNFLMFLGWNPGTEKEIYSLSEFINDFSLEGLQKSDLVAFDREKLLWFNGHYIRQFTSEELYNRLLSWADKFKINSVELLNSGDRDFNTKVIALVQDRVKKLSEIGGLTDYFYVPPVIDINTVTQYSDSKERTKAILSNFIELYNSVLEKDWNTQLLDTKSHEMIGTMLYKPKEAFMSLRVSITGQTATPPIFDIIGLIGKKETISRVANTIKLL